MISPGSTNKGEDWPVIYGKGDEQYPRNGGYPRDWPLVDHLFHKFQVLVAALVHERAMGWVDQVAVMYLKLETFLNGFESFAIYY